MERRGASLAMWRFRGGVHELMCSAPQLPIWRFLT
jgi:hypothetical protein